MLAELTDFGDLAVLVPLSAVLFVWLLAQSSRDKAWLWALTVAACTGTTALLKIYFASCPLAPDLHSPSGHTSFSTLVIGAFVTVLAARTAGWRRLALIVGGAALAAAIAVSRVLLKAHSPAEVVWGGTIGLLSLAVFAWGYLRSRPEEAMVRPLLISAVVLIFLLHGSELHAEEILRAVSAYLHSSGTLACAL